MKKNIINALCSGMLLLLAGSCGNKDSDHQETTKVDTAATMESVTLDLKILNGNNNKSILDSTDFSKANFKLVQHQIEILSVCAGNCSDNYCDDTECLAKIKKCHTVTEKVFDSLTNNKSNGFASYDSTRIANLINGANCKTTYIEVTADNEMYRLRPVTALGASSYAAYYSVALLQEIARTPIHSIEIYKGIYDASTGKFLVPFIVRHTGGIVGFYDVSSDLP